MALKVLGSKCFWVFCCFYVLFSSFTGILTLMVTSGL